MPLIREIREFGQKVKGSGIDPQDDILEFMQGKVMTSPMMDDNMSTGAVVSDMVSRYGNGNHAMAYSQLRNMKVEDDLQRHHAAAGQLSTKLQEVASHDIYSSWQNPAEAMLNASAALQGEVLAFSKGLEKLTNDIQGLPVTAARKLTGLLKSTQDKVDDCPYLKRACGMSEERVERNNKSMGMGMGMSIGIRG